MNNIVILPSWREYTEGKFVEVEALDQRVYGL